MSLVKNRLITRDDGRIILDYYQRNTTFFRPWEPTRPETFNEEGYWVEQLALRELQQIEKSAAYWVSENRYDGQVVAHCSLTAISFGAFRACYMGYAVDQRYEGKGIMKALCLDAIGFAFNELKLNRVMANHMPTNTRSEKLLRALGFVREGYAKRYIKINGRWEDHVLNALVNPSSEVFLH